MHETIVKHFQKSTGHISKWSFEYADGTYSNNHGPCHAGLMYKWNDPKKELLRFYTNGPYGGLLIHREAVNFHYEETYINYDSRMPVEEYVQACEEIAQWIITETSPWYNLFKDDVEVIRDQWGFIVGYSLPASVVKNKPYVYNFCCAARDTRDHLRLASRYKLLRNKGLEPIQAYLCAPYFDFNGNYSPEISQIKQSYGWNGGHQPLVDRTMSLQRLVKGEYGEGFIETSSRGWTGKKNGLDFVVSAPVKTKFSQIASFTLDNFVQQAKDMFNEVGVCSRS